METPLPAQKMNFWRIGLACDLQSQYSEALPPYSGDEKGFGAWRGWTVRFACQTGILEVPNNSGLASASEEGRNRLRELFSWGIESLPDGTYGGIPNSPDFRWRGVTVGHCKAEPGGVSLEPFGVPGHQVRKRNRNP
jgi:hypothetical protein